MSLRPAIGRLNVRIVMARRVETERGEILGGPTHLHRASIDSPAAVAGFQDLS